MRILKIPMQRFPPTDTKRAFRYPSHYKYYLLKLLTPIGFYTFKIVSKTKLAKRICLQWTSSNKGLITFENECISWLRCMSKVPVLQSWFKLLTLTKTARRLGPPWPAVSHLRRVWRKKMLFDRLPVPAPALPPLLSLELAAAELELSCIARSTLGARVHTQYFT